MSIFERDENAYLRFQLEEYKQFCALLAKESR